MVVAEPLDPFHKIETEHYTIEITGSAFQFEVRNSKRVVFPAYAQYGLSFLGSPVSSAQLLNQKDGISRIQVSNSTGKKAFVDIKTHDHMIEFRIRLDGKEKGDIRLRTGPPGPAYGLGDSGSYGESANLAETQKTYFMMNNGGDRRWVSSFVIFPQARGAGVAFDRKGGSVDIGPNYYEMSNGNTNQQSFYYIVGSIPEIYAAYRKIRFEYGYTGVAPKPVGFELGWESWDALRWNTNGKSVQQSIERFLDADYPIRWAVTGSGFWSKAGSTVHFGEFDHHKYPDENSDGEIDLKTWLHGNDIKWLIGQRINFVIPGGPHSSKPGESGASIFATSPDSQAGLAKGYFLTSENGQVVTTKSRIFPTVPCFLTDGNQSGAAHWFEKLYRTWEVDGVKEDTMMPTPDHSIFNPTMRQLAASGALVIARCGAYSVPGTLMRINDTHGPASMTLRAPINYLQYAACAAPNVYSDTVGFGHISDVNATLRHAWLTSLTAGMAVGKGPWAWSPEDQASFKLAVDFHYAIGPYLYSVAIESYKTGYPYTLTPLSIAFPDDENTYDLASKDRQQFEWMVGPSILATPLLHSNYRTENTLDIYLPSGEWIDYATGDRFDGPTTLKNYSMPNDRPPCFVGGKGVLVLREIGGKLLTAKVFPNARAGTKYKFYASPQSDSPSLIEVNGTHWSVDKIRVIDSTTGAGVTFKTDEVNGAIEFDFRPGHNYQVRNLEQQ